MIRRVILVVEDGTEYVDAFARLAAAGADVELLHAADAAAARKVLSSRSIDALFLDVVFDRTPPELLTGDLASLVARFGGDRPQAVDHLARNQGFYILNELAAKVPGGIPVLLAHDFSASPGRLAALREVAPGLDGVEESAPISKVLERLIGA
jgi:hypothetical protein